MTIFWTKRSERRLMEIRRYLLKEFGELSQRKFTNKLISFLELLSKFPELGTLEVADKNIYSFQLTRQTRVFYRINKNHISILTLFDNRQNPDRRPSS